MTKADILMPRIQGAVPRNRKNGSRPQQVDNHRAQPTEAPQPAAQPAGPQPAAQAPPANPSLLTGFRRPGFGTSGENITLEVNLHDTKIEAGREVLHYDFSFFRPKQEEKRMRGRGQTRSRSGFDRKPTIKSDDTPLPLTRCVRLIEEIEKRHQSGLLKNASFGA